MAAAAGATIGSCFSTAATTTTTTTSATTCRLTWKKYASTSDFALARIACGSTGNSVRGPALQAGSSSISYSHYSSLLPDTPCKITPSGPPHKLIRTGFRISASVEQEEVLTATETEASLDGSEEEGKGEKANEELEEEKVVEISDEDGATTVGGESTSVNESATNTKLYFGNLPYNCDSAQLAGIIQEYGSPEMVEVLYDRNTGRSRGFAFVTMSSIEDANAVIENLHGSEYGGRTLKVNFSDKPKPKEPLYPESEYKLFVGNLSWSVTSESLIQAFQEYGNVVGARVLYDGETGRSRGYGFVCYSSKEEMDAALVSLNGMELEGRALRVSLAQGRRN